MATPVTDPLCRMEIDPHDAAPTREYHDRTYYFCGEACGCSSIETPPALKPAKLMVAQLLSHAQGQKRSDGRQAEEREGVAQRHSSSVPNPANN